MTTVSLTSIHEIESITITEPRECLDSKVRNLCITTKTGARIELSLFGDNAQNIAIQQESI